MSARLNSSAAAVEPAGTAILLFTKAPVAGTVKTRLVEALGASKATNLHRRLTERALKTALAAKLGPVIVFCAPDTRHAFFRQLEKDNGIELRSQQGRDLGDRMHHAMTYALARHPRVLVIGSDCPEINESYLHDAAQALSSTGTPVVLGPAADGGYVLIGASRLDFRLFERMPWGTAQVLESTRARLRALDWQWQELAVLEDVDRPEDLARLEPELLR